MVYIIQYNHVYTYFDAIQMSLDEFFYRSVLVLAGMLRMPTALSRAVHEVCGGLTGHSYVSDPLISGLRVVSKRFAFSTFLSLSNCARSDALCLRRLLVVLYDGLPQGYTCLCSSFC